MRNFTQSKSFAASNGNISLIVGVNSNLALTIGALDNTSISASPVADPLVVHTFKGTLLDRSTAGSGYPLLGALVMIGKLTGSQRDAVEWLKTGIIGTDGEMWVRASGPFRADYGLCVYVPAWLESRTYVLFAGGTRE